MSHKNGSENGQGRETRGSLEELHALLADFDTAMLVTVTPEKRMRARPMEMQDPAELDDCDLWFVSPEDTSKIDEITLDHQVAVACYRPSDRAYVSISAVARIVKDQDAIRRLWKPSWSAWLPNGPEDARVVLLKLNVERAEYWEPKGGKLRILYEAVKGLIQGKSAAEGLNPRKHV